MGLAVGSQLDHMTCMGIPRSSSKLNISMALSAEGREISHSFSIKKSVYYSLYININNYTYITIKISFQYNFFIFLVPFKTWPYNKTLKYDRSYTCSLKLAPKTGKKRCRKKRRTSLVCFTVISIAKVDVRISERRAGLPVPANVDRLDVSCRSESIRKYHLWYFRVKIFHK